jgi:hypothetical protein
MKRFLFILLFTLTFCSFYLYTEVQAETATSTPVQINARILPLIWYSTLSIKDGDSIKIYAGIQNNSGQNFTGEAIFYVDDTEIAKKPFTSTNDTLMDISADWVANPGTHSIFAEVSTSLAPEYELVSSNSDKLSVTITRKVTPEVMQELTKTAIINIVTMIDQIASTSASKVESLRKVVDTSPINENINITDSSNYKNSNVEYYSTVNADGEVLGTSTGPITDSTDSGHSWWTTFYNWLITALAFLIRHWLAVIIGSAVIYFGRLVLKWGDK